MGPRSRRSNRSDGEGVAGEKVIRLGLAWRVDLFVGVGEVIASRELSLRGFGRGLDLCLQMRLKPRPGK